MKWCAKSFGFRFRSVERLLLERASYLSMQLCSTTFEEARIGGISYHYVLESVYPIRPFTATKH